MNPGLAGSGLNYFILNHVWLSTSSGAWVETGLSSGWQYNTSNPAGGFVGYCYDSARYSPTTGYSQFIHGCTTPDNSYHTIRIQRSSSTNNWDLYWDGYYYMTLGVDFWTTNRIDAGGEAYLNTTNGYANGQSIWPLQVINSSNNLVNPSVPAIQTLSPTFSASSGTFYGAPYVNWSKSYG